MIPTARRALLVVAATLVVVAATPACPTPGNACSNDDDCPVGTTCHVGICVDATPTGEGEGEGTPSGEGEGEGTSSEGEGTSSEGEGEGTSSEGEGEGTSSEGEGEGSGEGEGNAGEGEGEGAGGAFGVFVVPFSSTAQVVVAAVPHTSSVQATLQSCTANVTTAGNTVAFQCSGGLMGPVHIDFVVDGAAASADFLFVPNDWRDFTRTERQLVTIDYSGQGVSLAGLSGTTPIWIPAQVVPDGALVDAPAFHLDAAGSSLPLDVETDGSGAWTEVPVGTTAVWLYFHGASSSASSPPAPAFAGDSAVFHFGTTAVPTVRQSVEGPSLIPVNAPNDVVTNGIAGTAIDLNGQGGLVADVNAVTTGTGTLSCYARLTDGSRDQVLVYATDASSGNPHNANGGVDEYYVFADHAGKKFCGVAAGQTFCDAAGVTDPFDGGVHQLGFTWTSSVNNVVGLVIDGRVLGPTTRTSPQSGTINKLVVGGALASGGVGALAGDIDEVITSTSARSVSSFAIDGLAFANNKTDKASHGRRFIEGFHIVDVEPYVVPADAAGGLVALHTLSFPHASALATHDATVIVFIGESTSTDDVVTGGAGIASASWVRVWTGISLDAAHTSTAFVGLGRFDPNDPIAIRHAVVNAATVPATTSSSVVVVVIAGASSTGSSARNEGASACNTPATLDHNNAGATSLVGIASTGTAGVDAVGTAIAHVPADPVHVEPALDVVSLDTDASFVSTSVVTVPAAPNACAWGSVSFGP